MKLIAIAATSLDGFITRGNQTGTEFTSKADKQWFAETLKSFSIKILGRKTFDVSRTHILRSVQNRPDDRRIVLTRSPESYESDSQSDRLSFSAETPQQIIRRLHKSGHYNARVAILGGGSVYSRFLNAGLLDEFWITLEPKLFGSGTPLLNNNTDTHLKLKERINLAPSTLLLKYNCEK